MVELMSVATCSPEIVVTVCDSLVGPQGYPPGAPPQGLWDRRVCVCCGSLSRVVASHARAQVCFPHACAALLRWS